MIFVKKLLLITLICAATVSLSSCSTTAMKVSEQSKPGFSNIQDIHLPQSANIDINKSMVMGGGNSWTGHLAYDTKESQAEVVDFINTQMQGDDWTKLSELRGKETVISFMKDKRIATIRVTLDDGYFSKKTAVSVDMTNSKMRSVKHAIMTEEDSDVEKS